MKKMNIFEQVTTDKLTSENLQVNGDVDDWVNLESSNIGRFALVCSLVDNGDNKYT